MKQQHYSPWWSLPVFAGGVAVLIAWVYAAGCAVEYFSGQGRLFMTQEFRLLGGWIALGIIIYTISATIAVCVNSETNDETPRCGCRPKPPQGSGERPTPPPPPPPKKPTPPTIQIVGLLAACLLTTLCAAQSVTLPPSAAELSKPGKLAEWVATSLATDGLCKLPQGVIKTDRPIRLFRLHGCTIEGAGPSYATSDSKSGWRTHPGTIQGTTTIVATDPTQPALILDAAINTEIRRIGIETAGVGIAYTNPRGWGSANLWLHRVAFHGCAIGFKAGQAKSDHNAADVTFAGCQWYRCGTALEVNHQQGVNYLFSGANWFGDCPRAVVFNDGGFSHLQNLSGFNVGTWLTINGGGSNLMPCRVSHLYSDRTTHQTPPVIVDAGNATGLVRVLVDGVKVTGHGKADAKWAGHKYYRQPKNGEIRVRDDDLNSYATATLMGAN